MKGGRFQSIFSYGAALGVIGLIAAIEFNAYYGKGAFFGTRNC